MNLLTAGALIFACGAIFGAVMTSAIISLYSSYDDEAPEIPDDTNEEPTK